MSRGDGKALEKAAEALYVRDSGLAHEFDSESEQLQRTFRNDASAAIGAYLDALLSELPGEAVGAAVEAISRTSLQHRGDTLAETVVRVAVPTFLLSLRSSSRA